MTLPRRERRVLSSIGGYLGRADPRLARWLDAFDELSAGQEMPDAERLTAGARIRSGTRAALLAGLRAGLQAAAWLAPAQCLAADLSWTGLPAAGDPEPRAAGLAAARWQQATWHIPPADDDEAGP
jgi:hypothetical protein